jgi:MFS family permease
MMTSQLVSLTVGIVLCVATAKGTVTLGLLYALIVVAAIATAFDSPARMAFLPSLVGRAAFPRVATVASTNQALAFATGPALGGLLIADFGIAAAYAAYVVLILTALSLLVFLPSPPAAPTGRGVSLAVIREGLQFVRGRPVILGCMTLDMFAVIFGGATALLPIYATDILQVGPRGYGVPFPRRRRTTITIHTARVPMAMMAVRKPGPSAAAIMTPSSSEGNDISRSANRLSSRSVQPPK